MVFYGTPLLIQWVAQLFDPSARIEMSPFLAGVIALGAVSASFASEVFMSALGGRLEKGRWRRRTRSA